MLFHLLSFEGCDPYSRAGGIASRVSGLADSLAALGFETHLWFIGDPERPGHEQRGNLTLHRWCQWISRYHPGGVYDGEEGKRSDYAASLPPYLTSVLLPALGATGGAGAIVLAEEWQTADAVLHLDWLLRQAGVRERVRIFWNANNTFGFDRIDWRRLSEAACITTVSRYMKHLMWRVGVDALVVPNGLPSDAFDLPERKAVTELERSLQGRPLLAKMARWDPDKRWLLTIDIVGELKREGLRPLLIARGGVEAHGHEVLTRAAARGLRVVECALPEPGARGLLGAVRMVNGADVVSLRSPVDADARRLLFRSASVVLANSGHEPFGLVGLEAMAVGGLACTGCSGEDYAVPGRNALVMQTATPREFVRLFTRMRENPSQESALRRAARQTAAQFAWPEVVRRHLLPTIDLGGRPSSFH
jgi:glycosyltransferase involved in cell wall biosynthesis